MKMQIAKESWTRIGIVCTIASIVGGVCFVLTNGLVHSSDIDPLLKLLLWAAQIYVPCCVLSFAFPRQTRLQYIVPMTTVTVIVFILFACAQTALTAAICAAYSVVEMKPGKTIDNAVGDLEVQTSAR